ncbi:MAG: toll/interleukin-1 receptor domain-containing protein [Candidatus Elarobacter sp.]
MIFISYRRDDSSGHVGRLYDALCAHFGRKRLFFDIDHIAPGQDFVQVLDDSLSRSSVMIVVMGKRWAGTGKIGTRRIDDPGDFVRLEVASALRRGTGLRLIPALIQGAKMPAPTSLPEDLKDLSRRNAIEMSDLRWREDVERLIASLEADMAIPIVHHGAADFVRKAREVTHAPALAGNPTVKWGLAAIAAIVLLFAGRALFGHRAQPVAVVPAAITVQTKSAGMISGIPTDDPHAMPSHLMRAAQSAIASGKKWRTDAVLTQIVAAPASTGDASEYLVRYGFRSPTDGAGLTFTTAGSGEPTSERLDAIPMSTIRALPDSFIDLPAAVDSARRFGMFGTLKDARLAASTSRGAPHVAWRLRSSSAGTRVYFVDATTGANIAPAQAQATQAQATQAPATQAPATQAPAPAQTQTPTPTPIPTQKPKLKAKLLNKVKGLFHH